MSTKKENAKHEFKSIQFKVSGIEEFSGHAGEDENTDHIRSFKLSLYGTKDDEPMEPTVFSEWTLIGEATRVLVWVDPGGGHDKGQGLQQEA